MSGNTVIWFFQPTETTPGFSVDFKQFARTEKPAENLSAFQRTQVVSELAFQSLQAFSKAFSEALYKTFANSGATFRYIVLGYYGPFSVKLPENLHLAISKTAFWFLSMIWGVGSITAQLYFKKTTKENTAHLDHFSNGQIDMSHIRTRQLSLDTKNVPGKIKVDDLDTLFDQINFNDPKLPGYMNPASIKEGSKTYSKEELKEGLKKFIERVKNRTAFLGTPPAYEIIRLFEFYQQIEDATRLSIHKVIDDLQKFTAANGTDTPNYSPSVMNTYKDLLENQARLAIDLAIAGKHCGARYMGDSMGAYYRLHGDGISAQDTLMDNLIETLALKRKEIAARRIAIDLGQDTHDFSNWMASLGKLLGIPGTQNIVEHLAHPLNIELHLGKFFGDYTQDEIIDTLQEKAKQSGFFREQIIDWIKDHVGDWKKGDYPVTDELVQELNKIIKEETDTRSQAQDILDFVAFASAHLDEIENVQTLNWDDLLADVLYLGKETKWPDRAKRQTLNSLLSTQKLGTELTDQLKKSLLIKEAPNPTEIDKQLAVVARTEKIRLMVRLEPELILRILEGKSDLKTVLENHQEQERRSEFFRLFPVADIATDGIPKNLLEWLLVAHHILLPQLEGV